MLEEKKKTVMGVSGDVEEVQLEDGTLTRTKRK